MGYVGNLKGPAKSEIVARLGKGYFGISELELAQELEVYFEEEGAGEIDPVHIDTNGKLFLIFYAPHNKIQRFYLDEYGYSLHGKVNAIINNKETEVEL